MLTPYKRYVKPASFNKQGATCWTNVIVQSLLSVGAFCEHLPQYKSHPLTSALILASEGDPNGTIHVASAMRDAFRDSNWSSQCAHEAFDFIIDKLGADKWFKVVSERAVWCPTCILYTSKVRSEETHTMIKTFQSMLSVFKQTETPFEYRCEKCAMKTPVNTHAQTTIRRVSNVLLFVINQHVDRHRPERPMSFDVPSSTTTQHYELVAQINHYGGQHGGHYTAYFRRGSEWYYTNDSIVQRWILDIPTDESVYMLFYELQ